MLSSYSFIPISHKKSFTKIVTARDTKCIRDFFRCGQKRLRELKHDQLFLDSHMIDIVLVHCLNVIVAVWNEFYKYYS